MLICYPKTSFGFKGLIILERGNSINYLYFKICGDGYDQTQDFSNTWLVRLPLARSRNFHS
jgi:hypothetical protein